MRLRNDETGDVLEVPPPDVLGASVIKLNGRVIERVLYGDNSITLGDGRTFGSGADFAAYIVGQLPRRVSKSQSR